MRKPAFLKHPLAPVIIDVVVPIGVYFVLHAFRVADEYALAAGAVVSAILTSGELGKEKKGGQLSMFVTLMFGLGVVVSFIADEPRLFLFKPAIFVFIAGLFCYASLWKRPFMLTIAKPTATGGDAKLEALWESAWLTSRPFMSAIKASTVVFGTALIVDAIGRTLIVFSLPVSQSIVLANVPGIVALVVAIIYHLKRVKPVFTELKRR